MFSYEYINFFFQFGRLQASLIITRQTNEEVLFYRFEKSFITDDGNVADDILKAEADKHIQQILDQENLEELELNMPTGE